jgi:hypothetical protein
MNLVTALRQQFNAMNDWYRNSLLVNVILDYLSEETEDNRVNIEKFKQLMADGRLSSERSKGMIEIFYVDGKRVLSLKKTEIDIQCHQPPLLTPLYVASINFEFKIDYTEKPPKDSSPFRLIVDNTIPKPIPEEVLHEQPTDSSPVSEE